MVNKAADRPLANLIRLALLRARRQPRQADAGKRRAARHTPPETKNGVTKP
jgi:hypothetical protein